MHASMLSSSPGSQASPSTTSGGGPNMTPNASIAGSLTPSSLAAGSTTTISASTKATGGASDPFSSQQSSTANNNTTSKHGSKKNSSNVAGGQASTATGSSLQGNKKVFIAQSLNLVIRLKLRFHKVLILANFDIYLISIESK